MLWTTDERLLLKAPTCLAADLVGAKVLAVVEEVAAQSGADASAVSAQELVLLARGNGRRGLCEHNLDVYFAAEESADARETQGSPKRTAAQLIGVVATVADAVTPLRHLQTHAIVLAAERSGRRTLEFP